MSITPPPPAAPSPILYPDSDGMPMADNTRQAEFMVFLKTNLDALFAGRPDVFVAMDLLWYPVEGHPEVRIAPDVFVAFGRPKGHRGSYKQWEEEGIAPQVVFEVLSPGNRYSEMQRKFEMYERLGVEEYYVYDPEDFDLAVWRLDSPSPRLRLVHPLTDWVSPRLGLRFDAPGDREIMIFGPDGAPFRSPLEIREELAASEAERDRLREKLRALGTDPDAI